MEENFDYANLPEDVLEKLAELSLELSEGNKTKFKLEITIKTATV